MDSGLRYDLTLAACPVIMQIMPTNCQIRSRHCRWEMYGERTDLREGRFRQFMQCDIDILGEPSNLAEIELILATTTTLGKLGFSKLSRSVSMKEGS